MYLLVQSKLQLAMNTYQGTSFCKLQSPPWFAQSKVTEPARLEGVAFHSVSFNMAVPIGEVNDTITFEPTAFSKIHESKTF